MAFESLKKRTPWISATRSSTCSTPGKPAAARATAAAGAPSRRAAQPAASRSAARCAPGTRSEASGNSVSTRPSRQSRASPASKYASSCGAPPGGRAPAWNGSSRAPAGAGQRQDLRVVAVHDGPVVRAAGCGTRAPWPRRRRRSSRAGRDGRPRGSGTRRAAGGRCRSPRAGSWTPRARRASPRVAPSSSPLSGAPMLPPTRTSRPALAQHRPERRRRGGLALGARDGRHAAAQEAEPQLQLRHHRHARGARGLKLGQVPGHARRDHDERGARRASPRSGRPARGARRWRPGSGPPPRARAPACGRWPPRAPRGTRGSPPPQSPTARDQPPRRVAPSSIQGRPSSSAPVPPLNAVSASSG